MIGYIPKHVKMLLREIPPGAVYTYLRKRDWTPDPDQEARRGLAVWTRWPEPVKVSVTVPMSRTFRNYPRRLARLITDLAAVEHRSEWKVLFDLLNVPRCPDEGAGHDYRREVQGCGSYNVVEGTDPPEAFWYECLTCGIHFQHIPFYPPDWGTRWPSDEVKT